MNAYALAGNILLVHKRHSAARDIDKIAMGLGAVKGRVWQRKVEDECNHYLKTSISGSYETAGIVDTMLDNTPVPLFEDTELKEESDSFCLERHMEIAGKKFRVSSVFPKTAAATPTDKIFSLIDREEENI